MLRHMHTQTEHTRILHTDTLHTQNKLAGYHAMINIYFVFFFKTEFLYISLTVLELIL